MEIVPLDEEREIRFCDVLFMENKLVDHMLMFGDVVLKGKMIIMKNIKSRY
jgi:DNA primase